MTECKRGPSGDVEGKVSSIWSAHRMGGVVTLGGASRTATVARVSFYALQAVGFHEGSRV